MKLACLGVVPQWFEDGSVWFNPLDAIDKSIGIKIHRTLIGKRQRSHAVRSAVMEASTSSAV